VVLGSGALATQPLNGGRAMPPLRLLSRYQLLLHQVTVVDGVAAATVRSPSEHVRTRECQHDRGLGVAGGLVVGVACEGGLHCLRAERNADRQIAQLTFPAAFVVPVQLGP
jgi:hypothetical protein